MQSEFLKWGVGKVKKGHGIMFPTLSRNTLIFQVSEAHAEAMFAFAVILCRHLTTNFIACLLNYRHPNTVCRIAWDTRTWILCVFSQVLNGCLWKKKSHEPRWKNCHARSWGVSPAGARACCQACQSELSSLKWHGWRREVTPKYCPLTSTYTTTHAFPTKQTNDCDKILMVWPLEARSLNAWSVAGGSALETRRCDPTRDTELLGLNLKSQT